MRMDTELACEAMAHLEILRAHLDRGDYGDYSDGRALAGLEHPNEVAEDVRLETGMQLCRKVDAAGKSSFKFALQSCQVK